MVSHGNRDREKVGLRTDSSTAPFGTIRLLLSFSVLLKLRFSSINIYGAYLQAEPPTRDIFVRPHPGWAPSGIVWKIIRPAYGLWKAVVYGNWPLKLRVHDHPWPFQMFNFRTTTCRITLLLAKSLTIYWWPDPSIQ
jgi:hypothetical protein